jgi:hypothetical protein
MSAKLFRAIIAPLTFVVVPLLGGCVIVDNVSEDGVEGYLSFGFEESAFRPCGVDEIWWVDESSPSIELSETYQATVDSELEYVRVYARLIGAQSEIGSFGHLGAYDRTFTVSRIVDMRTVEDGDCEWPGDAG